MGKKIGVGILGGTGYGAGELLRLLASHSDAQVVSVVSGSQAGEAVTVAHQHLAGFFPELRFDAELQAGRFSEFAEKIVFAALPHGKSAGAIAKLSVLPEFTEFRFIDLSGDFRLQNIAERTKHYPEAAAGDEIRDRFVYGLTEANREKIALARFIANPGCLSSACALAALPLMTPEFRGKIVFDAKTGSSGGGKALAETMHHPLRHSNVNAYKILEHRHEPEIRETLGDVSGDRIETVFVPHLLPVSRGIFATAYLTLDRVAETPELQERYRKFYAASPLIRIRAGSPDLQSVVGSNFCDISVFARGTQVVAMAALDNLVKGMAGQAIQNMNVMTGHADDFCLRQPPLGLI